MKPILKKISSTLPCEREVVVEYYGVRYHISHIINTGYGKLTWVGKEKEEKLREIPPSKVPNKVMKFANKIFAREFL